MSLGYDCRLVSDPRVDSKRFTGFSYGQRWSILLDRYP